MLLAISLMYKFLLCVYLVLILIFGSYGSEIEMSLCCIASFSERVSVEKAEFTPIGASTNCDELWSTESSYCFFSLTTLVLGG